MAEYSLLRITALNPAELAELRVLSVAEGYRHIDGLAERYEKGDREFERAETCLYGWYSEGALVAIGGLTPDPYILERAGRIRRVYVHPDHRRAGLGRRLVEAILADGRHHFDFFTLRSASPEADALYLSLGFVPSALPDVTHEMRAELSTQLAP